MCILRKHVKPVQCSTVSDKVVKFKHRVKLGNKRWSERVVKFKHKSGVGQQEMELVMEEKRVKTGEAKIRGDHERKDANQF